MHVLCSGMQIQGPDQTGKHRLRLRQEDAASPPGWMVQVRDQQCQGARDAPDAESFLCCRNRTQCLLAQEEGDHRARRPA